MTLHRSGLEPRAGPRSLSGATPRNDELVSGTDKRAHLHGSGRREVDDVVHNNGMQPTALRAAADAER